jgi:hypothetical protein
MATENIKKQNRQQYYKDYAEKNKDKLKEDFICEICGGKYKHMSRAHHIKTKKHIIGLELQKLKKDNETMKNLVSDINKKIENI